MRLISTLIDVYSLVLLVRVVMSWLSVNPRSPIVMLLHGLTEPVLAPIRRLIPPMGGLDLSPMVVLIALQLLKRLF
jgi:YggT family protein